jgi:hypothetical protein
MVLPNVRCLAFLGLALAPCLAQNPPAKPAPAENPPGFDAALARYKECKARIPFRHHTEGRQRLAETRTMPALALLSNDYATTKVYPEETRYMLASLFGKNFDNGEFVDSLVALRTANQKPVDTWLWVHALRIQTDRVGDTEVIALAQEGKSVLQRAAAIAAVGASRLANLKAVIVPTCVNFPKKEAERMLLLGAMSGALSGQPVARQRHRVPRRADRLHRPARRRRRPVAHRQGADGAPPAVDPEGPGAVRESRSRGSS